jgi:putative intracellular protease/amidase
MSTILIALTSHGTLGDTGRGTGFYVPEAAEPHAIFTAAGHLVEFVSVAGGEPPRDGVKPGDRTVEAFLTEHGDRLSRTSRAEDLDPEAYDAILFAGGHGTMWDFPSATALTALAGRIHDRGGVVGAVCHGPAALVNVTVADGSYLVDGRKVSAFTNSEEAAVGLSDVVPFALESALIERGALFTKAGLFAEHAVADRRLVTGQNPASAALVAELMLQELAAHPPRLRLISPAAG